MILFSFMKINRIGKDKIKEERKRLTPKEENHWNKTWNSYYRKETVITRASFHQTKLTFFFKRWRRGSEHFWSFLRMLHECWPSCVYFYQCHSSSSRRFKNKDENFVVVEWSKLQPGMLFTWRCSCLLNGTHLQGLKWKHCSTKATIKNKNLTFRTFEKKTLEKDLKDL